MTHRKQNKLASDFTDHSDDGRLDRGAIGLQIHDKGMQVEFADVRLKQLVTSNDGREAPRQSRSVARPPQTKYLLLDSRVVESVQNAKLAVGTVHKHKSNPLFKEDRPWEPRYDNVYANVIYDEEQDLYKCWYSPFVNDSAYANTLPADRKPGTYMKTLRATGGKRRMGVHWHRIDPGSPLIPTSSNRDAYDWGCVYAAACPIVQDDEIRIYYGASNGPHTDWRDGSFALATLRPDGFAGYEPLDRDKMAVIETTPLEAEMETLRITADATGGSICVVVIDSAGRELATSQPITDSVTDRSVVFLNGLRSTRQGNSTRLRFQLRAAKLYAFSLQDSSKDVTNARMNR